MEFTVTEIAEESELCRITVHGDCPLCGVPATASIPVVRLCDEGDVVFEGCAGCLDTRVENVPEAKALLRVVLMVAKGPLPNEKVGTA